jgi:hypothetical protein
MLVVETIAKIRRLHLGQGLPIKAICRQLGLSRKAVRKVLRSGATEFRYARAEQPQPKLGAWREEGWISIGRGINRGRRTRIKSRLYSGRSSIRKRRGRRKQRQQRQR